MLLTVTPNPALDRTMVVPNLRAGQVHRAERIIMATGGKGMNVARAAQTLGQPLRVCAPLGGLTGQLVAQLAAEEGFDGWWSWHHSGETRTCVLIVDPHGSDATVVNEHGVTLSSDDWRDFAQTLLEAAQEATYVTISGSLPPGVPPAALADLIPRLTERGCRVLVDTSGPALTAALDATPYAVKVNESELATALQQPVNDIAQAVSALAAVRARGVALAVVSLGADGALAAGDAGVCHVRPPACAIVSSVGAGDSLLAGLATGLLRGLPLNEALRLGVACGTADALTIGGGLIDCTEVERLTTAATVTWLP
jgi:1-phosphofructokinase family hexose kinase